MSQGEASEQPGAATAPLSPLRQFWQQTNTLVLAIAVALAIRAFAIEPFRIPSGSMLPTLLIGDHLFVNKFSYGIRVPFTDFRLPGLREPRRGDIAVFTVARRGSGIYPADERPDLPTEEFVKRIIGLPGDAVEVSDGGVFVNGELISNETTGAEFNDEASNSLRVLREPYGHCEHFVLDDPRSAGLTQRLFIVPEGRYFVMGDNRDHSNDSRAWGTVSLRDLKGPAFILYWSWHHQGGWLDLLNPLTWWRLLTRETRWERIGQGIC